MKPLLIIISFIIMTGSKPVHQDRLLKIDANGNIIGLPKEYGQSTFDLEKKYLRINDKEVTLPECISHYFKIHEKPELTLSASWYHSKDIMPYYLNFDISKKSENFGYSILIDLETLELIYVKVSIQKGNTTYNHKIHLLDSCLNDYKKNIKVIKK